MVHRAASIGFGTQVPGVSRCGLRALGGYPGVHQYWREHGSSADERVDAAAHELRAVEPDRGVGVGGITAACLSRGHARESRLGDGAPQECFGAWRMSARPILVMGEPRSGERPALYGLARTTRHGWLLASHSI